MSLPWLRSLACLRLRKKWIIRTLAFMSKTLYIEEQTSNVLLEKTTYEKQLKG